MFMKHPPGPFNHQGISEEVSCVLSPPWGVGGFLCGESVACDHV